MVKMYGPLFGRVFCNSVEPPPEVFPPTGQRSVITVTSVIGHIFQLEFDGELSSETWDIEIDGLSSS